MINKKIVISFLGLAVLLQISFAVPLPADDSKSSEESPLAELDKFAVIEFNNVADTIVPKEIEVLKLVLKDLKADDNRTDNDNEVIEKLENLLKIVDEADKTPNLTSLELFFKINAIIDPYDEHDKPSKKNPKVHDLLQKHNWNDVRDKFDAEIVPKIDELDKKVNDFYNKLSEDEKKKHKDVGEWLEKYKDKENDAGDKINLLLEFISFD